ncbi:MAG TPA: acyl carrier protein [Aurantimonas sp.]|jgi:acyl carrier protein|nr:acyl carrier protein [Aurantimonas sp.]
MSGPSKDAVAAEVIGIVAEVLGRDPAGLRADTRAEDVEGWDSFALVRMVFAIEAAFPVRFTMAEIEEVGGMAPLIEAVQRKVTPPG